MARFQRHLFVCLNERGPDDPRGCCMARGSPEVLEALKEKAHACGLKRIVRVNRAGCLDQCAKGVTVVVYPEGTWYGGVTVADVDEIVERHLLRGQPVQRLIIPDRDLTGRDPPAAPDPGKMEER